MTGDLVPEPRRATGGIVSAGAPVVVGEHGCTLYLVGEHGPERIVPSAIPLPRRPLRQDGVVQAIAERLDQPRELPPATDAQE